MIDSVSLDEIFPHVQLICFLNNLNYKNLDDFNKGLVIYFDQLN